MQLKDANNTCNSDNESGDDHILLDWHMSRMCQENSSGMHLVEKNIICDPSVMPRLSKRPLKR